MVHLLIEDGFEVISDSFIIEPVSAKMGEVIEVNFLGRNTDWQAGITWPNFGDGIQVLEFTVLSNTLAESFISIDATASPGLKNVTVDSGGQDYVTLYDGFKVDRVGLGASFDPSSAKQGETIEFTVRARGTDFTGSQPVISFFDRFGENPDIVVNDVTVLDSENLYGRMTLSNAASLGERDVQITTSNDSVQILMHSKFWVVTGIFQKLLSHWPLTWCVSWIPQLVKRQNRLLRLLCSLFL